jgi:hypothetical protein
MKFMPQYSVLHNNKSVQYILTYSEGETGSRKDYRRDKRLASRRSFYALSAKNKQCHFKGLRKFAQDFE